MKDLTDWKAKLIGRVTPRVADGGHQISPEQLLKRFSHTESVSFIFCTGCGAMFEIDQIEADKLARKSGSDLKDSYVGTYFESNSCTACNRSYDDVKLIQPA